MSTTTTTFNKGDIVRATNKNIEPPESHEFTVQHFTGTGNDWIFTTSGLYLYASSWTFELVKAAAPPLPTTPGLYSLGWGRKFLLLTGHGAWHWVDFTTSTGRVAIEAEPKEAERRVENLKLVFDFAEFDRLGQGGRGFFV